MVIVYFLHWHTQLQVKIISILRKCILDGMSSLLEEKCGKFINNKYPNTYRNTIDYINKTNMENSEIWGGDLELFTAGFLFNTDIWVSSKETGNSWNVFSGKVLNFLVRFLNSSKIIIHDLFIFGRIINY